MTREKGLPEGKVGEIDTVSQNKLKIGTIEFRKS